jgi:hypothetical protein
MARRVKRHLTSIADNILIIFLYHKGGIWIALSHNVVFNTLKLLPTND